MPFERPSLDTIYGRMKADLEEKLEETDWLSRSFLLVLLAVFSGSIYLCYGFLVRLSKQFFFNTADEEFVLLASRKYGLVRIAAEFATGSVRATGVDTSVIPADTEIQTDSGVIFLTDQEYIISGTTIDMDITAKVSGTGGNVDVTTMSFVTAVIDVDTDCTVLTTPNGGVAIETIQALVTRLLQRAQNPPGSGSKGDLERWALEIAGVGRVWVLDAEEWAGASTAAIVLASSTLEIVDSAIKADVVTNIDAKKAVGADIDTVDIVPHDVVFEISISPNSTYYQDAIDTALEEAFILETEPGGTFKITSIYKAIGSTGVSDWKIDSVTVNGSSHSADEDIESEGLNTPRFASATYSELT